MKPMTIVHSALLTTVGLLVTAALAWVMFNIDFQLGKLIPALTRMATNPVAALILAVIVLAVIVFIDGFIFLCIYRLWYHVMTKALREHQS